MRRLLAAAALCALVGWAGRAWAAPPAPAPLRDRPRVAATSAPSPAQAHHLDAATVERQLPDHDAPIQAYYHDSFFGEPWRLYGYYRVVERRTAVIVILDLVLGGLLWGWSARRRRPVPGSPP